MLLGLQILAWVVMGIAGFAGLLILLTSIFDKSIDLRHNRQDQGFCALFTIGSVVVIALIAFVYTSFLMPAIRDQAAAGNQAVLQKVKTAERTYYQEDHQRFTGNINSLIFLDPTLDGIKSGLTLYLSPDGQAVKIHYHGIKYGIGSDVAATVSH